jgi:guanylate kinase
MKKGLLFVLSVPSGSGKGTVLREVLSAKKMFLSISATSRVSLIDEVDGENYFFLTREEFQTKADNDEFLEYTETYGNYYGTPKQPILDAMESGEDIMLEIDTVGALTVKSNFPEAILIFLSPPTIEELKSRLILRGTETFAQIETRIGCYIKEMNSANLYDYLVINDHVGRAKDDIIKIIEAEHLKVKNNLKFITKFKGGTDK